MTTSDSMRLTSSTITPGAQWNVNCQVAALPPKWLEAVTAAYRRRGFDKDWSLPTKSLIALLIGLDPAIIHVGRKLSGDRFIVALPGADTQVLAAAVAAWATTGGSCASRRTSRSAVRRSTCSSTPPGPTARPRLLLRCSVYCPRS